MKHSANLLLAALPKTEHQRLAPFLTHVDLKLGQTLIEPEETIRYVWFPNDAITSTIQMLSDGSSVESGLMGLEGMVGIQLWLRQRRTAQLTNVQIHGTAERIDAEVFLREVVYKPSPLNDLVAAYTHGFLVFTGQAAACNRLHSVDQRLSRWLTMVHNRLPGRKAFPLNRSFWPRCLGCSARPSRWHVAEGGLDHLQARNDRNP